MSNMPKLGTFSFIERYCWCPNCNRIKLKYVNLDNEHICRYCACNEILIKPTKQLSNLLTKYFYTKDITGLPVYSYISEIDLATILLSQ